MNFKYECKRFQRNHQLINSNSHKNLTVSFDKDNQMGLIQSIDDSRGLANNINHLNETASVFQRLDQLESAFQFEKKERFHECNRLMKMIRQMECKHSSIIYESQIKYCKSPTKPEIFFSPNNALLKKVSSSHQTYKNGKQNKGCNEPKCQKTNNFDNSQKNQDRRANIQKNFLTPVSKYNPQRQKDERKQCKKEVTEQYLEYKILKTEQNLNQRLKREVESLKPEIMKEVTKKVDDFMKNIVIVHEKDLGNVNSNTEKLQKNIEECKRNTKDIFQKLIKQIQNVEYVWQENNRAELDNIYAEIDERIKQIEVKTQYSINKVEQILEAFERQKQDFTKQRESAFHAMKDKLEDSNQVERRIQVLQKEIKSNKFEETTIKLLQNYIKESLKEFQLNLQGSFATSIKQVNVKSFQMEGRFSNEIDSIRSRIENIVLSYSHQNSKIKNLQFSSESNFNIYSNKINEILQTLNSELSSEERNRQIFIEFQRLRAKQIQNEKRNQQIKREKQRQFVCKMVDQKMSNKVEIFRIVSSKQIQTRCSKIQDQMLRVIQRHIKQVENFMTKIAHQEQRITSRFLGTLKEF